MLTRTPLFQKLLECQPEGSFSKENLVASPFSVAHTLAFLWSCADDKTAEELAKVLGFKGRLTKEIVAKLFSDYHEDFLECAELKMGHKVLVNGKTSCALKSDEQTKKTLENFSIETETATECLKLSDFLSHANKWASQSVSGESVDFLCD